MTDQPQKWTAEQTAHPNAAEHGWAIIYDPTPGGVDKGNGKRSYSMRWPCLLLSDYVDEPEDAAKQIAAALNRAELEEVPA